MGSVKKEDISQKNDISKEEGLEVSKALDSLDSNDKIALKALPESSEITRILNAYPEGKRDEIQLTKDQVVRLLQNSKVSTFGVNNTLPLICKQEECPFESICVFQQMGIAPLGERCPEEIMYLDSMIPQLITDFGVDLENYLELNMVQEYASALLDKRRADKMIALEGDVKEVATSVVQATGTIIYEDKITPYVDIKEKSTRKLSMIRKELLATREQRAKYKLSDVHDPSTRASDIKKKFLEIKAREQQRVLEEQKSIDDAFEDKK